LICALISVTIRLLGAAIAMPGQAVDSQQSFG